MLAQETRALLTRLERVRPLSLQETMVPAAAIAPAALTAIETTLSSRGRDLKRRVRVFLAWLGGPPGQAANPEAIQKRFTLLRLSFNAYLSQLDIFSDALTQRSEQVSGVWLAGLDAVASDALTLPGSPYQAPDVICYLDRGHGAAIRRARTRLPGGGRSPVAVIRLPRERLVGCGLAGSLVHEVGHQGAVLIDLIASLRLAIDALRRRGGIAQAPWSLWERWIPEIVADLWSLAKVGAASTLGLMGVVSLPRVFVFRHDLEDPHPIPWIRVKLSCAMGQALYPDPQWARLADLWESYYPRAGITDEQRVTLEALERTLPAFVAMLLQHRPRALAGKSLRQVMAAEEKQPGRLRLLFRTWRGRASAMRGAPPSLVFAALGQARLDGAISPEAEGRLVADLLTFWAWKRGRRERERPPVGLASRTMAQ